MKVGDVIQFVEEERIDGKWFNYAEIRLHGIVLEFDEIKRSGPHYANGETYIEKQIKVLWNTGQAGWILQERIEAVEND